MGEEGKPPTLGPDVKLMAQCTDSLTTLMNNKAKVIQGLNGITSKVADQSKPAKTKAESKAQPAKPAAKKSEANKPPAKPAELGEGGEVGRNWPGLKSMSRKDIKQFLDDVGHLAVESTKLLKGVGQPDCCRRVRQVPQVYQAHGRQHVAKCERVYHAEAIDSCRTETEKGQHPGQG